MTTIVKGFLLAEDNAVLKLHCGGWLHIPVSILRNTEAFGGRLAGNSDKRVW